MIFEKNNSKVFKMKRIELFEFEDFDWLPNVIRTSITNLIAVFHRWMGTADVIAGLIIELKSKCDFKQIVDIGSGSGGAMPDVIERVNERNPDQPMQLILTDLHPNPRFVAAINDQKLPYVHYHSTSIDASSINQAPKGLKTMIASFHHMKPEIAQQILLSAQRSGSPILIYEIAKNNVPVLIWGLLLPLSLSILIVMTLIMTPFVKRLSLAQVVFTYLIPIIPLIYAWDGQASLMRTYTFEDVETLLAGEPTSDYQWTIDDAKNAKGKTLGYRIMGYPRA